MKHQFENSTSFSTRMVDRYLEAMKARGESLDDKTPLELWEDMLDFEPCDIVVQFEDGTFGRPAFDRRSGRVVRFVEARR